MKNGQNGIKMGKNEKENGQLMKIDWKGSKVWTKNEWKMGEK